MSACDFLLNASCTKLLTGASCSDVKAKKDFLIAEAISAGCNQSDAIKVYNKTLSCACDLSTGAIVGIVVGSIAFIALVIALVMYMRKKKKR